MTIYNEEYMAYPQDVRDTFEAFAEACKRHGISEAAFLLSASLRTESVNEHNGDRVCYGIYPETYPDAFPLNTFKANSDEEAREIARPIIKGLEEFDLTLPLQSRWGCQFIVQTDEQIKKRMKQAELERGDHLAMER
jgi:hypothetical protein